MTIYGTDDSDATSLHAPEVDQERLIVTTADSANLGGLDDHRVVASGLLLLCCLAFKVQRNLNPVFSIVSQKLTSATDITSTSSDYGPKWR